jgi:hypothetical protein
MATATKRTRSMAGPKKGREREREREREEDHHDAGIPATGAAFGTSSVPGKDELAQDCALE